MIVAVNEFVKRQVKGSGKTYAKTISFDLIAKHSEEQMLNKFYSEGYRDGVRIVHADQSIINDFVCPYVELDENTQLVSKLVKRSVNEDFYIQTRALNGKPIKTGKVDLIIYRHDVLMENNEHSTDADWELISINAIPQGLDSIPMGPITMMRNQLDLIGGTNAQYQSNEWAESVRFWQKYAALEPNI